MQQHRPFDIDFVRANFPAFSEPSLDGWAFFENAGGSYPCKQAIERLTTFYGRYKVQPYAPYPASEAAGAMMDEAREGLAALLNVGTDEVSFGPSTSQNTYVLAQAFRQDLRPGDAIVVTNQDHEANSGAGRRLAEAGIVVREWRIDPESGHLDPAALDGLLDEKVRLCAFPHCSNVIGEINPVAEISAKLRAAGVVSIVDGVSYAPHGLPDVQALGCDVYLFSSYKTYGPHQGIMTVRRDLAERLPNQGHFFNSDSLPKRFTPAGPDHAQVAACAGMVDYIEALAAHHGLTGGSRAETAAAVHDLMRAAETERLAPLLDYLRQRNDIRLLGPAQADKHRAPTVALDLGQPAEPVAAALAQHKIMAGGSDFYAVRPLEAMGVDLAQGVLRVSFTHYTSAEEIEQLTAALDAIL